MHVTTYKHNKLETTSVSSTEHRLMYKKTRTFQHTTKSITVYVAVYPSEISYSINFNQHFLSSHFI